MPTKSRKSHKKTRRKTRTQKSSSSISSSLPNKVNCCVCGKAKLRNKTLIPLVCLRRHGERAHRICNKCWWDKTTGFAREDAEHGCPGCKKGFPFTEPLPRITPRIEDIIVISD